MLADESLIALVINASLVVQLVMLILLVASVISWTRIFSKRTTLGRARRDANLFEDEFWSGKDLVNIYNRLNEARQDPAGMERIFHAGFKEFARLRNQSGVRSTAILDGTQRVMRVALRREVDELELHLPFLAIVGSTSPYIGLFGTVWGIMNSFRALGNVTQATIAMVAPGIAEALIATAMGLFAAIPAVIAYNHFVARLNLVSGELEGFSSEFIGTLAREGRV